MNPEHLSVALLFKVYLFLSRRKCTLEFQHQHFCSSIAAREMSRVPLCLALLAFLASPALSKLMHGGAQVAGGVSGSTEPDEHAKQAASQAISKLNSDEAVRTTMLGSGVQSLTLLAIKDVRTQVVAGTNYCGCKMTCERYSMCYISSLSLCFETSRSDAEREGCFGPGV
jgi:hypothetical protein